LVRSSSAAAAKALPQVRVHQAPLRVGPSLPTRWVHDQASEGRDEEDRGDDADITVDDAAAGCRHDIGSSDHWVCGPARGNDGKPGIRKFGTTTANLQELSEWLIAQGTKSAAMESTSVYWIPLYKLLESRGIEPMLVNARQLHNVPGRKTDVSDCLWLQVLHSCRPPARLVSSASRAAAPDGQLRC
jgi:hypothetical protein